MLECETTFGAAVAVRQRKRLLKIVMLDSSYCVSPSVVLVQALQGEKDYQAHQQMAAFHLAYSACRIL